MPKSSTSQSTQSVSNKPASPGEREVRVIMLGGLWEPMIFSSRKAPSAPKPSPQKAREPRAPTKRKTS